jgi:hypothetical protein
MIFKYNEYIKENNESYINELNNKIDNLIHNYNLIMNKFNYELYMQYDNIKDCISIIISNSFKKLIIYKIEIDYIFNMIEFDSILFQMNRYNFSEYKIVLKKFEISLNFLLTFDTKHLAIDLHEMMYRINYYNIVIDEKSFNENIFKIIKKDSKTLNVFNNLKTYLNEENLKELEHLINAKNFDLI